jgi:uncharacterized protein (DUF4415 family)
MEDMSDTPEFTAAEMAAREALRGGLPQLAASARRIRGKQKAPTKQLISLRLDKIVIDAFKAKGPGWQRRMNEALKKAIGSE